MRSLTLEEVSLATEISVDDFHGRCHEVSLALVRSGILGEPGEQCRVARGSADGVGSQHSWVALGDPYDEEVAIVDPTITTWWKGEEDRVWFGTLQDEKHFPHGGEGSIWQWGQPQSGEGEDVIGELDLCPVAKSFTDLVGPLDAFGLGVLLSQAPVRGWPSAEVFAAVYRSEELRGLAPIDRVGMLTSCNPSGLYW